MLILPPACNVTGCNGEIDDASTDARVALSVERKARQMATSFAKMNPGKFPSAPRNLEFQTELRVAPEFHSRFYCQDITRSKGEKEHRKRLFSQAGAMTRHEKPFRSIEDVPLTPRIPWKL